MPSGKYRANVDCMACHPKPKTSQKGANSVEITFVGSKSSCADCHNRRFVAIADTWKTLSERAFKELEEKFALLGPRIKKLTPDQRKAIEPLLKRARHNYSFVRAADGIHNIYYATQLLRQVEKDLESIASKLRVSLTASIQDSSALLSDGGCNVLCHDKIGIVVPPEKVRYNGWEMSHSLHTEVGLGCEDCHRFEGHKNIRLRANAADCQACHEL